MMNDDNSQGSRIDTANRMLREQAPKRPVSPRNLDIWTRPDTAEYENNADSSSETEEDDDTVPYDSNNLDDERPSSRSPRDVYEEQEYIYNSRTTSQHARVQRSSNDTKGTTANCTRHTSNKRTER